jgi:hypothetical protein
VCGVNISLQAREALSLVWSAAGVRFKDEALRQGLALTGVLLARTYQAMALFSLAWFLLSYYVWTWHL